MREVLAKLFALFFFLTLVHNIGNSTAIGFNANYKFLYTGKASINMLSLIILNKNQSNWYLTPMTVAITFQRAAESSEITALSGFRDLSIQNLNQGIDILTDEYNVTTTCMYVDIYTKDATHILKLSVSYVYFQPYNQYFNSIDYETNDYPFQTGQGSNFLNLTTNSTIHSGQISQLDTTEAIQIIIFMKGIRIIASGQPMNIDLKVTGFVDSQAKLYYVIITCLPYVPSNPNLLKIGIFLYSPHLINSDNSPYFNLYSGNISSNTAIKFASDSLEMTSFNTFIGLNAFTISNASSFSFLTQIDTSGITITPSSTLNFFNFHYIVVYSNYCDYKTPYFDDLTQLCWDECPAPRVSSLAELTCTPKQDSSNALTIILGAVGGVVGIIAIGVAVICIKRKLQANQNQRLTQRQCLEIIFSRSLYLHGQQQPNMEGTSGQREKISPEDNNRIVQNEKDSNFTDYKDRNSRKLYWKKQFDVMMPQYQNGERRYAKTEMHQWNDGCLSNNSLGKLDIALQMNEL